MELKNSISSSCINRNIQVKGHTVLDRQQQIFSIKPSSLHFKDVTMGNEYHLEILIQNKTQNIVKFKIYGPKQDIFKLDTQNKSITLSSGLSKKIKVTFTCKHEDDYYDEIKIVSQQKTYVVPIKATRAFFNVKYNNLIQGGIVAVNTKNRFATTITNLGSQSRVRIIKQNQQTLTISPDQFVIQQGQQQEIGLIVIPTIAGTYRHKLLVQINGQMSQPINLIYSSTQFKFLLTSQQGKTINQLDIGYCHYGQRKTVNVIAVNNTSETVTFKSKIRLGWKFNQSALQSPQQLGIQCSSTIIQVIPNNSQIKPFSKIPLSLVCLYQTNNQINSKIANFARRQQNLKKPSQTIAVQAQVLKMMDNQCHQTLIAQFNQKKIYCSLKVTCGYPLVKIQPSQLTFGQVKFKKTDSRKIKVRNVKQNLDIKVNFPKAFSFQIIPSTATIGPDSQHQFQLFLTPVSYGYFNTNIMCVIANIFKIQIPVSYEVPSQIKKQSNSAHFSSQCPLRQLSLTMLNKTIKTNYSHRNKSLNSFKIKTSSNWSKNLKPISLSKDNFINNNLQTSTDVSGTQKFSIFQPYQRDDQLTIGGQDPFKLPRKKDTLFVTRKIDKYEPYKHLGTKYKAETRQSVNQIRKIPKNKKQHLELCKQLPIEALKNVNVTQKIINFGKVFVHSKITKQFQIINNNDFSIQVKLTPEHQFLSDTDTQPQVLSGKSKSKLKIVLFPKTCGQFQSLIVYTINSVHHFRFLVQAQIELVTLNLSKFNLKLGYQDDAKDMLLTDVFDLTNQGNTEAHFSIQQNSQQLSIQPKSGMLISGQSITISVIYNLLNCQTIPAGQPKNIKDYNKPTVLNIDQRIVVKVKNGVDMYLRVQSNTPQPKCYVKQTKINFGCCMVPKSKSKSFVLRNISRSICLYQIDSSGCQNFLQFDQMKGKVLPQSSKQITVTYKSNTIHQVNMSFKVVIRGGLIINVPFHAESVAPKISILQNSFNFGQICCGNTSILPINIKNDSQTMVELLLDLLNRHSSGVQYLDVSFESLQKEDKSIVEKVSNQPMIHKIKVQAKSTLKFYLLFQPHISGIYEFQLPIYIQNFIKNDMISKLVTCYAKQPKFFLEPGVIKFKKKIINDKDNACFHPLVQFVTLKNPSDVVLKWKIELPKTQNGKKLCFEVQNRKGEVKANSWQCINIAFNPYQEGIYCYKFPVLIYNWQKADYVQQAEIKVQGQGQYPLLLFDRRQLILPVVPLQVESVGMFKIINQGYETIDIKHRIHSLEQLSLIPEIIPFYPEGTKMGINKKELYVIIKFIAKKPVSFTAKLQIYDGCRSYSLPVSGTSDNSLFTNFPYLSDKQNLYKLQTTNQSINLRNIDTRNIIDRLHNHYDQVTQADYTLSCQIIRRWINTLLKDQKVIRFPQDIVNSNETLLRFLFKITNKKDLQKVNLDVENQEQFYEWIIRILKSMGCLLNHIRPYFLLNKQTFQQIFQQDPKIRHMADTYKKYYRTIHLQSWIILFYQVVSNFWYNPQKVKTIDLKSNIYSTNQTLVLKWIRQIYVQYNEGDDRKFVDLNKDFKDCFAPIYALYHYNFMNKNQSLEGLNKHTISSGDYSTNIRMLYLMMAKANLIPLISEDEFQNIKQKEMFMLLYQLYESLPQQFPKTAPIIFVCELGQKCIKYIQIKNPSNKYVNYWIRIEGSSDYSTKDQQSIRIEPKGVYKLGIEFKSRVSQQQIAYLMLFNKKQSDNNSGIGCSLVFELKSQIVGRKSIKKLQTLRCPMYQNISLKIPVQNTFNDKQYGNFKITLSQQLVQTKQNPKIINFYVELDMLKIRRNTNSFIQLFYSPMILKSVRCFIIFCDPAVGQFQYEITGTPQVPKPLQQIKVQNPIYLNTQQTIELNLPVYNNYRIKSLSIMQQKWSILKTNNKNNYRPGELNQNLDDEKQQILFKVEVNMDPKIMQFIKFPNQITIFHKKKTKNDIRNKLKIQCNFNIIIKDLILDFVLLSADKRDIRRFKAQVNVTSQPILNNLLMRTNARTPLTQQIPFQNVSNKDWKINCQILQMETNEFTLKQNEICLQKDYVCKKNSSISSHIIYYPDWISQSSCKLKITNLITNEQVIYSIKGICQQPLSEDHIYYSTFTGKSNLYSMQIKNPYNQKLIYYVSTDLVQLQFPPEVILEPNEKATFDITITINSPGIFIGFIKFVDKSGRYFWYSITIQAEDQVVCEENIKFQSLLDEQIQKVLQFKNSLSKTSQYKVDFDCQYLIGERSFDIKPYSSYLYRIKFKPSRVINQQSTIRIFCPEKGAYIYKVQMIAHQHYKRQLLALKVEVGRIGFRQVKLTQVNENKQNFSYSISNPNFYIQCSEVDKHNQITVRICYKPISEGSEKCIIKLIYGFNKTKMYEIQGIGIAPFTIQSVQFESVDLKPVLQIIKFKNPYQRNSVLQQASSEVCYCYIQKNDQKLFSFVGYGQRWETKIKDILAIPIQFKPKQQGYFQSMLTVQTDQYRWQYLLKGSCISQISKNYFDEQIRCKTREEAIKVLAMQVPQFLKQQGLKPNKIDVYHPDSTVLNLIKSCLKLKIEMNDLREDNKSTIYLRFKPNKPIKQIVTFSLFSTVQQSVKVHRKIKLVSEAPEPQQTVNIQINSIKRHILMIPIKMQGSKLNQAEARMQKGEYFQSRIMNDKVQVKFTPNNCTFKNNLYSDLLIVQSKQQYRSFKLEVKLQNKTKISKKEIAKQK